MCHSEKLCDEESLNVDKILRFPAEAGHSAQNDIESI